MEEIIVQAKLKKITSITGDEVKEVIAQKTGIPLQTLSVGEKDTLLQLESELNKVIIGQQGAVISVVEAIQRSRVGLTNPNKPIGSFLFLWHTGVGKTEFAKQLARIYFKDEKAFMRFDMSEYQEKNSVSRLIGAPPGYVGYEEGGKLVDEIKKNPYSLLLLDEIEKANSDIFNVLLQVMDYATLTDINNYAINKDISVVEAEVLDPTQKDDPFGKPAGRRAAGVRWLPALQFRCRVKWPGGCGHGAARTAGSGRVDE